MINGGIILGGALGAIEGSIIHPNFPNIEPNLDGTYDFTLRYTLGNYQNDSNSGEIASNLRLSENDFNDFFDNMPFNSISVPSNSNGGNLTINPNFNGDSPLIGGVAVTPDENLVIGGSLNPEQEDYVEIDLNIGPLGEDDNGDRYRIGDERIFADDQSGNTIDHVIIDGSDPTRSLTNGPAVVGRRALFFRLEYDAEFTVNKTVTNVSNAASGTANNFDITYQVDVTANASNNVNIYRLSALDDLTVLGSNFVGVVNAPTVTNVSATSPPTANSSFNGSTGSSYGDGIDLLSGNNTNLLAPGQSFRIIYTVEVNRPNATTTYNTCLLYTSPSPRDS